MNKENALVDPFDSSSVYNRCLMVIFVIIDVVLDVVVALQCCSLLL